MTRAGEWWRANRPVVKTAAEVTGLQVKAAGYEAAYRKAPWHMTAQHLLSELDPRMISWLQRLQQNEVIVSPFGSTAGPNEKDRLRVVQWARWWAVYDPLISAMTKLWTAYGFGQEVSLQAEEPEQVIWDAFWTSKANRRILGDRHIRKLSNSLLTDGELFLVIWKKRVNGECTIRTIKTEEITEIISMEGDKDQPLYYKREWMEDRGNGPKQQTRYYPDWLADPTALAEAKLPPSADRADQNAELVPVVIHVSLYGMDGRGWPLCTASEPWAKAYKQFATDRAAVARNVASVIEEYEVKGGPRMVDMLKSQLQSGLNTTGQNYEDNPPPGAGSYRVQNEAVNTRRLPMSTGASDAAQDSMMLIGQAATGTQSPAFMLGRTDMAQNRAIAEVAMRPTLRAWGEYQNLWRSVFEDIFTIVMDAAVEQGQIPEDYNKEIIVSLGSVVDVDFDVMVTALGTFWDKGIIAQKVLTTIALQQPQLGLTSDVITATIEQMYPEGEEPEEEPGESPDGESEEQTEEGLEDELRALRALVELTYVGALDE